MFPLTFRKRNSGEKAAKPRSRQEDGISREGAKEEPNAHSSSRPRVSPLGLNHRRLAAKITESRKRTLFPSDEAAEPTHPRWTMTPPGKTSPHASGSGSASVSRTHGEEPGSIPIHLGSYGPSQAVAPGPEGRQTVAQRVSAGFRPHMENQPQRGDRFPASSHTGQQLPARTDSSRPLRSRRKDAKTGKELHPVFVPSPFASSREPSQLWDEISREGTKRRFHLMSSVPSPARN